MRLHTIQLLNVFVRRIRGGVRATRNGFGELENVFVRRIRACVVYFAFWVWRTGECFRSPRAHFVLCTFCLSVVMYTTYVKRSKRVAWRTGDGVCIDLTAHQIRKHNQNWHYVKEKTRALFFARQFFPLLFLYRHRGTWRLLKLMTTYFDKHFFRAPKIFCLSIPVSALGYIQAPKIPDNIIILTRKKKLPEFARIIPGFCPNFAQIFAQIFTLAKF